MAKRKTNGKRRPEKKFAPPPHANADTHRRVMHRLAHMTDKELFETAVQSGIFNEPIAIA
jgi:hypothetical protein